MFEVFIDIDDSEYAKEYLYLGGNKNYLNQKIKRNFSPNPSFSSKEESDLSLLNKKAKFNRIYSAEIKEIYISNGKNTFLGPTF